MLITTDDVFAYLASLPKRERPAELRSDTQMLSVWLGLRDDEYFYDHVIVRHNLTNKKLLKDKEHAVGNAWGICIEYCLMKKE